MVWFREFATERAACNGSTPAGESPVTVLPQEGCVVIPDSGFGRPASGKLRRIRPRRPEDSVSGSNGAENTRKQRKKVLN
jgi:hypothetical protein